MSIPAYTKGPTVLMDYLHAALPAAITSVNAARFATLKSRIGPFSLSSSAKNLLLAAQGGAAQVVTLTTGSRTAAQVASEITTAAVPNLSAAADTQGRLVLSSTVAATSDDPSRVTLGAGEIGTPDNNAAARFGWNLSGQDVIMPGIVSPMRQDLYEFNSPNYTLGQDNAPRIAVVGERVRPNSKGVKSTEYDHVYYLDVALVSPGIDQVNDLARATCRAIQEAIAADRTLYGQVVYAEVSDFQAEPKVFRFRDSAVPVALATVEVLLRSYGG